MANLYRGLTLTAVTARIALQNAFTLSVFPRAKKDTHRPKAMGVLMFTVVRFGRD